jgi:hypothetical protein
MPSRRRRRRGQEQLPPNRPSRPAPNWKWFTFPVYLALTAGLFLGYNLGVLLKPHSKPAEVAFYVIPILLWIGLAQLATRPFTDLMLRRRARQQNPNSSAGPGD